MLAVRAPESKDEARCAIDAVKDVKKRLPGMLGLSYDGALRGTHIRELARDCRIVAVSPITAKKIDKNAKSKRRTEKSIKVAHLAHTRLDGIECHHDYRAIGGRLCERQVDSKGKTTFAPCDDPFVRFQDNKRDHRMYLRWEVRCSAGQPTGAQPTRVGHLDWTITDDSSDFNVAENLRALPPGSPRYDLVHGWRQTVENDNHQTDARKVQCRGRSSRPDWNHLNELGWAIMNNGIALQRARRKRAAEESPPQQAQAA